MHTQSQLNGENAFSPSESFGRIGRSHPSAATSPRSISGRGADRTDSAPARGEIGAHALLVFAANGFGDATVGRTEQHLHLSSARLDQGARAPRSSLFVQSVEATLRTVGAVARRMYASWKLQQQTRAAYVVLRELDAHTLRDLGFDSSEIFSVAAAVASDADSTRACSVQALRGPRF